MARPKSAPRRCGASPRLFLDGAPTLQRRPCRAVRRRHRLPDRGNRGQGLAELARRLAPIANAPTGVVSALAQSDDIAVAGRVLKQARLADPDLDAHRRDQKPGASARDVDAPRDQRGVIRHSGRARRSRGRALHCQQSAAQLSDNAFATLVKRAEQDGVLAEKVGMRDRYPAAPVPRSLLMQATEVVQRRLLSQAKPETQAEIRRVLAQVTDEVAAKAAPRNYAAALAAVRDAAQGAQAQRGRHRRICQGRKIRGNNRCAGDDVRGTGRGGGPFDERRAGRSGPDSCARGRFGWPTVKAIINARPGSKPSAADARCRAARISTG